ncbi:MAG: tRNA lysidine(34) synthetase TilS [Salinivirgaceae bacterium]
MLNRLKKYIQENTLCGTNHRILVAVSGGADSVVLLHLLHKLQFKVALAHCNFMLREKESNQDEQFVKALKKKYQIEGHFITFQTKEYATSNKISIEMAARDLRYQWFEQLCIENGYSKIATGHHLNDSIETLFLNLTRGTGINGITGISPTNGKIIRPLLFATRIEIEEFAKSEKLDYRNDSSNDSLVYMRNIIRQQIIPTLKSINPAFEQVMSRSISNFNQAAIIYNKTIQEILIGLIEKEGEQQKIDIKKLQTIDYRETLLFEFLSPLGFSADSISNIFLAIDKEPGRLFFSDSYQLLVDRDFIFIEAIKAQSASYVVNEINDFKKLPLSIHAQLVPSENYTIINSVFVANLDADKIQFPITIRHWNAGDRFFPLGMKQPKKISDFFTDLKIDRLTKDKIWILESGKEIAWIMGHRIDDRFKVTQNTREVLQLKLQV